MTITNCDLETLRKAAINDIKSSLCKRADEAASSKNCQIRIATAGMPQWITLTSSMKIVELNPVDISVNYPNFPIDLGRGLYDPAIGKIILCQGKWCRETVIHETLHSTSFSSVRSDLRKLFLILFEGLTEFFTGYILFRLYPGCYKAWKENQYPYCSVTYAPSVRLWASFCRFIPIEELVKIYFWDGTLNWEGRVSDFLNRIHQYGYPNFDDFTKRPYPTVEMKILEECLKNFGREKFRAIYEGPLQHTLDFSKIVPSTLPI
jgi:hypothetical protein